MFTALIRPISQQSSAPMLAADHMNCLATRLSLNGKSSLIASRWQRTCALQRGTADATAVTGVESRQKQQGTLRLFLDSANVAEWERWAPTGTLYGFTTNPLILDKDGVPCTIQSCKQLLATARGLGVSELQCQAWGGSSDALEASACALLELDPDFITVKLPCTPEGLAAAAAVLNTDSQASITITGVYQAEQVLVAQAAGADYMAPYLGRIADQFYQLIPPPTHANEPEQQLQRVECMLRAMDRVADMQAAVDASGSSMRILVASIRSAADMAKLAARGCNTFTFSPAIMEELCCVPQTLAAAADFEAAAARNT